MKFSNDLLRISLFTSLALTSILLASCSNKSGVTTSQMRIQFPTISQTQAAQAKALSMQSVQSSSASASMAGFDWSLVCYMVNVSASDIKATSTTNQCDIPLSIASGSVKPGDSLTLDVPAGQNRTVDVLVYLRTSSTDACPSMAGGFGPLSRTRIVRVGSTSGVDMTAAKVDVEVDVTTPATGVDLVSQYSLPTTCRPTVPTQGSATSRLSLGHSVIKSSSTGLTIVGSVSSQKSEAVLTGNGLTMHLTRQTN